MRLRESLRLAWRSIVSHPIRSSLTTVGIVIGVAAVILFVTLGASLQAGVVSQVEGDKKPELRVAAAPPEEKWRATMQGEVPVFTKEDVDHIRSLEGVETVYTHDARAVPEAPKRPPEERYARLTIEAEDYGQLPSVRERTAQYLQTESDASTIKPGTHKFILLTNQEMVGKVKGIVGTFTSYIIGVALLSWIVGGIGIVNIMLVSVIERTQSIGTMKAIGATNRDVLQLFLAEAVILGLIGAILGTLIGGVGGAIGASMLNLPLVIQPEWAVFAVISGIGVGLIAGGYPALRAARIDPIEALRH